MTKCWIMGKHLNDIRGLVRGYYDWLADNTVVDFDPMTEWCCVTTPFLGSMNDHIEIFIKRDGDRITMSDDGMTLWNLELEGVNVMKSPTRRELVKALELNFGIRFDAEEITMATTVEDFSKSKHDFLQALQQVSDLRMTKRKDVVSMFSEDVKTYLDRSDVIYTPNYELTGESGLLYRFDLQIAGRKSETVVKAFNSLRQSAVAELLFGLHDTRKKREETSRKRMEWVAMVNDVDRKPQKEYLAAFGEYGVRTLLWSQRDKEWNSESLVKAVC